MGYSDLSGPQQIRQLTDEMLFSYSFKTICDFMTCKELLKFQSLNKYLYESFMPNYFTTCKERKNCLRSLKMGSKVNKEAILLFQDNKNHYMNSFDLREWK